MGNTPNKKHCMCLCCGHYSLPSQILLKNRHLVTVWWHEHRNKTNTYRLTVQNTSAIYPTAYSVPPWQTTAGAKIIFEWRQADCRLAPVGDSHCQDWRRIPEPNLPKIDLQSSHFLFFLFLFCWGGLEKKKKKWNFNLPTHSTQTSSSKASLWEYNLANFQGTSFPKTTQKAESQFNSHA